MKNTIAENYPDVLPESEKKLLELDIFLGSWQIRGQDFSGTSGEASKKITGNVFYHWMPGHFFMLCNWHRKFGSNSHIGMGIIGFDEKKINFSSRNYDNSGNISGYRVQRQNNIWKFIGDKERAVIEFSPDGHSYTEDREINTGGVWRSLYEIKATKI